jgi:hypothetical protein
MWHSQLLHTCCAFGPFLLVQFGMQNDQFVNDHDCLISKTVSGYDPETNFGWMSFSRARQTQRGLQLRIFCA